MQNALSAIHQELKRLRNEGVGRVYLDDSTLEMLGSLQSVEESAPSRNSPPSENEPSKVVQERSQEGLFPSPPEIELPDGDAVEKMQWLHQKVKDCAICSTHLQSGGKLVFGEGNEAADIFFCGEAPGEEEARTGRPFVGPAGQLLDKIIAAMGLSREQVYIANILKWRPEHDKPYGNRPPTSEEMAFCLPYLKAQIEIVQPKLIVALGNTAVTGLLGPDPSRRMGKVRGTWQEFQGLPLMITFHPSYLLRKEDNTTKRLVWEDMLQVMEKVGMTISEKQRQYFKPASK